MSLLTEASDVSCREDSQWTRESVLKEESVLTIESDGGYNSIDVARMSASSLRVDGYC